MKQRSPRKNRRKRSVYTYGPTSPSEKRQANIESKEPVNLWSEKQSLRGVFGLDRSPTLIIVTAKKSPEALPDKHEFIRVPPERYQDTDRPGRPVNVRDLNKDTIFDQEQPEWDLWQEYLLRTLILLAGFTVGCCMMYAMWHYEIIT